EEQGAAEEARLGVSGRGVEERLQPSWLHLDVVVHQRGEVRSRGQRPPQRRVVPPRVALVLGEPHYPHRRELPAQQRRVAAARAAAKRIPAAYALADAARAAALAAEKRRGLTVYHETNHAAPPFQGPIVLTVHDLSTIIVPQTEEVARVRHFAPALRMRA